MEFNILESITNRKTRRTFEELAIPFETKFKLNYFLKENEQGPLGSHIEFHLIDLTTTNPIEIKKYGSFGLISPGGYLIVGSVSPKAFYLEDYGYLMEKIVLYLNYLGIGSSWMSSHFNAAYIASTLSIQQPLLIPALITCGFSTKNVPIHEKLIRWFYKADSRKAFNQMFFEKDFQNPIDCHNKSKHLLALEMLRKAPSSGNNQPWRVIKVINQRKFHFYLQYKPKETQKNYMNAKRIDMGCAMCHFAESMKQLNYSGTWSVEDPMIDLPNGKIEYTATWSC